jgi:hypothetical protein
MRLVISHRGERQTRDYGLFLLEVGVEPSPDEETHEAARAFCECCTVKYLCLTLGQERDE